MSETKNEYAKPEGAKAAGTLRIGDKDISYATIADWLVLRDRDTPKGELFHVAYLADESGSRGPDRPITFVFNGGPGAASAYLHVGAVGPRRVVFGPNGEVTAPPATLTDNQESWLAWTDLVFIDPIGTGFSRGVKDPEAKDSDAAPEKEYWKLEKDLASLGEFISQFLSTYERWDSPVFLAGESYGGFRAAKLARSLQERYGVGLNGVLLISPALEFALLDASEYDVLPWIDVLPSMIASAAYHDRAPGIDSQLDLAGVLDQAEEFAARTASSLLINGARLERSERESLTSGYAGVTGLDPSVIERVSGRIGPNLFVRELLREQGLVCGLYDATVTTADPFPGTDSFHGPDPTLRSIERLFAAGINTHLRRTLGIKTEREYRLLSMDVNQGWEIDTKRHAMESQIGATDDLRYAMSLNPHLRVRISHGVYDLITPYFASERIAAHMRLPEGSAHLSLKHYKGGHMFYSWDESRIAFAADVRAFYEEAAGSGVESR